MVNCLNEAGYDENNPQHLLISIGDAFDRGEDSVAIYEYLKRLSDEGKAIVLKGNHTKFLIDYLDGTSVSPFNWQYNGTNTTLDDFMHQTQSFLSWCLLDKGIENPANADFAKWIAYAREQINTEYPELLPWLKERPYYFETEHYIFTHGAIQTTVEDWHKPHCVKHNLIDWDALTFNGGDFFGKEITNTDKNVVIGHFHTRELRRIYNLEDLEHKDDILVREDGRVIAIDACTPLTHKVNVLVIEDSLI